MRDLAFVRAHLVQRYENALATMVERELAKLRAELTSLVRQWDYSQVGIGNRMRRYDALVSRARERIAGAYHTLGGSMRNELIRAAKVSATDATRILSQATGSRLAPERFRIPTRELFEGLLRTNPVQGAVMGEWWAEQSRMLQRAFARELRMAVVNGESAAEAVRRVRGGRIGAQVVGGIMNTSIRNAKALVRTSFTDIYNGAAYETFKRNPTATKQYEYVATLDERTTEICQSLDGNVYSYDDPDAPRPPQHWNCRSTIVPVIDWAGLGLEPIKETRVTYRQWIGQQPPEVQDRVFGKGRAEQLRSGKAEFNDLVKQDGRRVSLGELNRRLSAA